MAESRCGVCCDSCERKQAVHCTGCTQMKMPFWGGECAVQTCCEKKELDHCGLCDVFPCEMVATMGVEMGFDPAPRLENCRNWGQTKQ